MHEWLASLNLDAPLSPLQVRMVEARPGIAFIDFENEMQSGVALQGLQVRTAACLGCLGCLEACALEYHESCPCRAGRICTRRLRGDAAGQHVYKPHRVLTPGCSPATAAGAADHLLTPCCCLINPSSLQGFKITPTHAMQITYLKA